MSCLVLKSKRSGDRVWGKWRFKCDSFPCGVSVQKGLLGSPTRGSFRLCYGGTKAAPKRAGAKLVPSGNPSSKGLTHPNLAPNPGLRPQSCSHHCCSSAVVYFLGRAVSLCPHGRGLGACCHWPALVVGPCEGGGSSCSWGAFGTRLGALLSPQVCSGAAVRGQSVGGKGLLGEHWWQGWGPTPGTDEPSPWGRCRPSFGQGCSPPSGQRESVPRLSSVRGMNFRWVCGLELTSQVNDADGYWKVRLWGSQEWVCSSPFNWNCSPLLGVSSMLRKVRNLRADFESYSEQLTMKIGLLFILQLKLFVQRARQSSCIMPATFAGSQLQIKVKKNLEQLEFKWIWKTSP